METKHRVKHRRKHRVRKHRSETTEIKETEPENQIIEVAEPEKETLAEVEEETPKADIIEPEKETDVEIVEESQTDKRTNKKTTSIYRVPFGKKNINDQEISEELKAQISDCIKNLPSVMLPHNELIQKNIDFKFKMEDGEIKKIPCLHRRRFTPKEDQIIISNFNGGSTDWIKIAELIGNGRTADHCRLRYRDFLSPDIKTGPWEDEDKELLKKLVDKYGPAWSSIAKFFPGRRAPNVKNEYISITRSMEKDPHSYIKSLTKAKDIPKEIEEIERVKRELM